MKGKILILRGEEFDRNWPSFSRNTGLINFWNEKKFAAKADDNLTYRAVNHWTDLGLLDDDRTKNKQWKKLSLRDFIWLHIIKELRSFGFPNEKIMVAKKNLFLGLLNGKYEPIVEYYLTCAFSGAQVYLVALNDGSSALCTQNEFEASEIILRTVPGFVLVNLNLIFKSLLPGRNFISKAEEAEFSEEELAVVEFIRSKKYKKIELILRGGRIEMVNATESMPLNDYRIIELIKQSSYQKITVEVEHGKVVSLERTHKTKNHLLPKTLGHLQENLATEKLSAQQKINPHAERKRVQKLPRQR